jgi:twitching motility protein PilT
MDILSLIRLASEKGASDLHLIASKAPIMRLYGKLQPVDEMPVMTSEDIGLAFKKMAPEEDISRFEHFPELDFGYNTPDSGRLRVNVSKQRGTISLAIRLVPSGVPSVDQLGLPKVCKELVLRPRGLVVVSGPTGSGKSTTLAAMINYLNQVTRRRVVTVDHSGCHDQLLEPGYKEAGSHR